MLHDRLTAARPDYSWLSEESGQELRSGRHRWIVDPIDGTRAFIEGKPEFTVCVALMDDNRPVLGAIFNPATNELFESAAGGGTRLNGKVIPACGPADPNQACLLPSQTPRTPHGRPA